MGNTLKSSVLDLHLLASLEVSRATTDLPQSVNLPKRISSTHADSTLYNIISVSYTHLDVYKRQVRGCI